MHLVITYAVVSLSHLSGASASGVTLGVSSQAVRMFSQHFLFMLSRVRGRSF